MDKQRRKELQQQYKEMKTYMGVFKIENTQNGKVVLGTSPNLKNQWLTLRMQLDGGRYSNKEIQQYWKTLGEAAFAFEVVEQQEVKEETDVPWELKMLLKKWMQELQPYEPKGYHKKPQQ
ncbi:MAG: GIY-YIG nuclease family protein [Oscillospiraceae bacterium]